MVFVNSTSTNFFEDFPFPSFAAICARQSSGKGTKEIHVRCQPVELSQRQDGQGPDEHEARSFFDNVKVGII
jgi:hypothetical protein